MRKIKFISILLVLSMLLTVPVFAFSTGFTDVSEKATYAEAVSYLADAGILRGTASGRFSPNEKITISQWATMLCRAFDTEPEGTSWQETGTNAVQIAVRSGWLDPTAVWDKNGFICRGELYRTAFAAAGIPLYDATLYSLDWLSPGENALRVGKKIGLCAENKTAAELVTRAEATASSCRPDAEPDRHAARYTGHSGKSDTVECERIPAGTPQGSTADP